MKKLLVLFLLLFVVSINAAEVVPVNYEDKRFRSQPITGAAPDTYPVTPQAEWTEARNYRVKQITILNTDASDSLIFKIEWRNAPGSIMHGFSTYVDITLPATDGADFADIAIPENADKISVSVKGASAGNNTLYNITMSGDSL